MVKSYKGYYKIAFFSLFLLVFLALGIGNAFIDFFLILKILIFFTIQSLCNGFIYLGKFLRFQWEIPSFITHFFNNENIKTQIFILFEIRLPRVIFAGFAGAGLSISGLILQSLYRNPLISPSILAVSPAAAFGTILAIFFELSFIFRIFFGFSAALMSILFLFLSIRYLKEQKEIYFILSGLILSAFFFSLISFMKYLADPQKQLPEIINWLMGTFAFLRKEHLLILIPMIFAFFCIFKMRYQMNNLLFYPSHQNLSPFFRPILLVLLSFIVAAIVSVSGHIAWVGLIIPNLSRLIIQANHEHLVPFTFLFGAHYMIFLDILSRSLTLYELPIGLFTAFSGALIFFFLFFTARFPKI